MTEPTWLNPGSWILSSGFLHTSFVDFDFTVAKITHNFTNRLSSPNYVPSIRFLLQTTRTKRPRCQEHSTVADGVAVACALTSVRASNYTQIVRFLSQALFGLNFGVHSRSRTQPSVSFCTAGVRTSSPGKLQRLYSFSLRNWCW